jgi:hypothetical protein
MGPETVVDDLLFDGTTIWGYSATRGLCKSDDIGKSWGFLGNPGLGELQAFKKLGARLCAVNSSGVYLSADQGVTWTGVEFGADTNRSLRDAFISGSEALLTSTSGFFRTSDAGETWESLGAISYEDYHRQLFRCFTNEEIFIGCNDGLWRHPIAKPIEYYTPVRPRTPDHAWAGSGLSYTLCGRTLRFRTSSRFSAPPRLTLISVTGRTIAELRPAAFNGTGGTAVFRLENAARGAFIYRLVQKDAVSSGVLIIP